MTKQEYLRSLRLRLQDYSEEFQKDILDAFEGHFQEGLNAGQTEEEVMESLGTVDEVAENIRMMNPPERERMDSADELRKNITDLSRSIRDTLFTVGDIVTDSMNSAFTDSKREGYSKEYKKSAERGTVNGDIRTLIINSKGGSHDIVIEPGESLDYIFEPGRSLFSKTAAALTVGTEEDSAVFVMNSGTARLKLTVPESIREIGFDLAGGDLYIDDIHTGFISGKTASGDIELNRVSAERVDVRSFSGDIRMEECVYDDAFAKSHSGDIQLRRCRGRIDAECLSGDIDIDRHTAHKIVCSLVSGDADIAGDIESAAIKTVSGDIEFATAMQIALVRLTSQSGDIDATIDIPDYHASLSSLSGDVDIDLPDDVPVKMNGRDDFTAGEGNGVLYIDTKSGDIRVD